jgi:two-component system CheB/CheR fusion protein
LWNRKTSPPGLASLLAGSGLALLALDEDLRLAFLSPAALSLLGLRADDLGQPLPRVAADPWLTNDAAEVLAHGTSRLRQVLSGPRGVFLRRAARQEGGVVVTYADLAERQAACLAVQAVQERSRVAEVAQAQLLATAGHDLRQPVQILGLLQGLALRAGDPVTTQRLLRQMEPMIGTIAALLDQMRDAARGPAQPPLPPVPLGDILARLQAEFGPRAAARGLELRVIPSSAPILSDPVLLGQILRELLSDALDQAPPGRLVLGCRRRGERLQIVLRHGVAPPHPSPGLADALAQQLGHPLLRGQGGATLEVMRERGPVPAVLLPPAPRTGCILMAEGDPALRGLLAELLAMEGHRVVTATDAEEALRLAPGLEPAPDIVLADEALPGALGGVALGQALRGLWGEDLPVLVLTEGDGAESRAAIAAAGQVQLPKPVKPHCLASLIQCLLPAAPSAAPPAAPAGPRLVYLVDDDAALCVALRAVLGEAGYTVRDYPSAEAFLAAYQRGGNACLLVDARLPGLSGLELLARLRAGGDSIPSVMITGFTDLATAVLAMRRGAADFVTKPVRLRVLLEVLERAMAHAQDGGKRSAAQAEAAERLKGLTQRQREILDRVLAGEPSKNIAADLGISRRTVEVHRAAIMKQFKVRSLPALVRLVLTATGQEAGG